MISLLAYNIAKNLKNNQGNQNVSRGTFDPWKKIYFYLTFLLSTIFPGSPQALTYLRQTFPFPSSNKFIEMEIYKRKKLFAVYLAIFRLMQ